jgi:hypothetical protein
MDAVWIVLTIVFFGICLAYVGFLDQEGSLWKT